MTILKNLSLSVLLGLLVVSGCLPTITHAQGGTVVGKPAPITFTPEVKIPRFFDKPVTVNGEFFGKYIYAVFVTFMYVVGVLAVIMVIWGGIKWVGAAGNPARINDARDTINSAIIGVIIALVSVTLLNIINPNLTKIGLPDIANVNKTYFYGSAATSFCLIADKVNCGTMKATTSTVKDPNGKTVQVFCMGTICKATQVCSLTKTEIPYQAAGGSQPIDKFVTYGPGQGCVTSIPLNVATSGDYQGVTSLKVFDSGLNGPLNCQDVDRSFKYVGSICPGGVHSCYITKTPGVLQDNPGDNNDYLLNMACATQ